MGRCLTVLGCGMLVVAALAPLPAHGQAGHPVDPELLRLVERAVAWYPDSSFRMTENSRSQTPSGAYRSVTVERDCAVKHLSGPMTVLVDDVARIVWIGSVARLPFRQAGVEPTALGKFVQEFLPEALADSLNLRVKVDWTSGPHRPGALIPFWLLVETGYGTYRMEAAVASDGELLALGAAYPMDRDPVAFRRELLASSDLVVWDLAGGGRATVDIVEFSDLECPACRAKWPIVKEVTSTHHGAVRHGMVSFPLTTIHPWAFRSAAASWCVSRQGAELLAPFKELFYSLQTEMEVSQVTPTAVDFVAGNGLDEQAFRSCYLREPSLDAVHGQLALGHRLGVIATPTYFVNGWLIQAPDETWFGAMVERVLAGDDLQ